MALIPPTFAFAICNSFGTELIRMSDGVVSRLVHLIREEPLGQMLDMQSKVLEELDGLVELSDERLEESTEKFGKFKNATRNNCKRLLQLRSRLDALFLRIRTLKTLSDELKAIKHPCP